MSTKNRVEIAAVLMAVAIVIALTNQGQAQTKFLATVRRQYQLDRTTGKCDLCHLIKPKEDPGRKNLNVFGKAMQADPAMKPLLGKDDKYEFSADDLDIVKKVAIKLEDLDSDGDGATNKEELDLGTFPGDPKSVPDKAKLDKYRKDHPKK